MIAPSGASTGPLGARGCGRAASDVAGGSASDGNCGRERGRVVFPWCVSRETHHGKSDMRHPEDSMNDAGSSLTGSVAGGPRRSGSRPYRADAMGRNPKGDSVMHPRKARPSRSLRSLVRPVSASAVLLRALRLLVSVVRLDSCSTFHVKRREVSLHVIDSG